MESGEARRAVAAAMSTAARLGLAVDDADILNDSNRLVVRLTPADTVARVTPVTHHAGHRMSPEREVEVAKRLARLDSPVAPLEDRVAPQVLVRDGFKITFWAYREPLPSARIPPVDYLQALRRLHRGLRRIAITTPHAMDRVAAVEGDIARRDLTPDLAEADRTFLAETLRDLKQSIINRHAPEQLLHGEPHPGNVLRTKDGTLFIDFENIARGPVEYDLGWVPREVSDESDADQELVGECRGLVLATVAAYRWRRDDRHPSGRESGLAFLRALRDGPPWPALDDVTW